MNGDRTFLPIKITDMCASRSHGDSGVKFDALLHGYIDVTARLARERSREAQRFNVFEALGLERREIYLSRFLAHLLDPMGNHDQGILFLSEFLRQVLPTLLPVVGSPRVTTEQSADDKGRIDICIWFPSHVVVIENKVDASEGTSQIQRYDDWRRSLACPSKIVFLTPTGRPPATGSADKFLSYEQLAGVMHVSMQQLHSKRITEVIQQFIDVCRVISQETVMSPLPESVFEYLTQPQNLDAALELETSMPNMKLELFNKFWMRVKMLLEDRLSHSTYPSWEIRMSGPIDEKYSQLGIFDRRIAGPNQFCVMAEALTGNPGCIYGIFRGIEVEAALTTQEDKELTAMLTQLSFCPSNWWCGYKVLKNIGLPKFSLDDKESVISINDAVHAANNITLRVTDLIWELFESRRNVLEALNTNYGYQPS
jgi:hypothetical protein